MRKSILLTAVLSTLAMANIAYAEEAPAEAAPAAAPAEPESAWTATSNIGFASDYYFRGISQSWHKPAVQGGFDVAHSSGFYAGVWGSNVSPNTYPDASVEIDLYGGYNGTVPGVEGLGWTVGLYNYFYPGGSWKKYRYLDDRDLTPKGGRWDTSELNFGISYKWISAKISYTLTDWFGADKDAGWDGSTKGSTYIEINAAYPLPWWDLTLVGHVGRLNVAGELDLNYQSPSGVFASTSGTNETKPDYTDYKVGLSKSFKIAKSEGWNAGVYYVGASNRQYWGDRGYGGSSFNGSTEAKNLNDGRVVVTVGRTF